MASQTWESYLQSRNVNPNASSQNQSTAGQLQTESNPLGDVANLYSLYNGGNALNSAYGASADAAQGNASTLQQQMQNMPTLDTMYGQNSPYAQAMRQSLAAKDAAAGRNSQYGNREVQLQAALADKGSQYASAQAQMANQYTQAQQSANNARSQATLNQQQVQSQQLAGILGIANKTGALQAGASGLSGLYHQYMGNGSAANQSIPDSPYGGGGNYQGYTTGQTSPAVDPNAQYQSNSGLGQMYGQDQSNYAPGMNTSQAPTSSNNAYNMDEWLQ